MVFLDPVGVFSCTVEVVFSAYSKYLLPALQSFIDVDFVAEIYLLKDS